MNPVDEALFEQLEKLGIHAVRQYKPVQRLRTGLPSFDQALWGGIPRGLITEIWGVQKNGKTTALLLAAGNIIKGGGRVMWIDMEHRLNHAWAAHWGCNPKDQMQVVSPASGEEAFNTILTVLDNNTALAYDLIILDSMATCFPAAYHDGQMGEGEKMASRASLQTSFASKVAKRLEDTQVAFVYINQVRQAGVGKGVNYGYEYMPPGAEALKHFTSIELLALSKGNYESGFGLKGKTKKNSTGPDDMDYEITILTNAGYSYYQGADLFNVAYNMKLLTNKSGEPFSGRGTVLFEQIVLGTSQDEAKWKLQTDPEVYHILETACYARMEPNYG